MLLGHNVVRSSKISIVKEGKGEYASVNVGNVSPPLVKSSSPFGENWPPEAKDKRYSAIFDQLMAIGAEFSPP